MLRRYCTSRRATAGDPSLAEVVCRGGEFVSRRRHVGSVERLR